MMTPHYWRQDADDARHARWFLFVVGTGVSCGLAAYVWMLCVSIAVGP